MMQTWLVDLLIQVSVATVIGLLLVLILRKSPAARYAACSAVFLAIALSPISSFVVARSGWTSLRIPVLKGPIEHVTQVPDSFVYNTPPAGKASVVPADYLMSTLPASVLPNPSQPIWFSWAISAWGLGVLLLILRLAACAVSVRRIVRGARPSDNPVVVQAAQVLKERLGVRRLPQILVGKVVSPFAVAWPKPSILLPESLPLAIAPEDLGVVLAHELGHIEQGHGTMLAVQRTAQTIYWPHPLVHWLSREMSKAREEVCDNFVLHVASPCRLARTLLLVAETAPAVSNPAVTGLLLPHWRLEQRVSGLLDPNRKRSIRISRILMTTLNLTVLSLCAVAAGVQLTSAQSTVVVKQGGKTYVLHASKKRPVTVKVRTKSNTQNIVVTGQGVQDEAGVTFSDDSAGYVVSSSAPVRTRVIKLDGQTYASVKAHGGSKAVILKPVEKVRVLDSKGAKIELVKPPTVTVDPRDVIVKSSPVETVTSDGDKLVVRTLTPIVTTRGTIVQVKPDVVKDRQLTFTESVPLSIVKVGEPGQKTSSAPVIIQDSPSKAITLEAVPQAKVADPGVRYTIIKDTPSKDARVEFKFDTTVEGPKLKYVPTKVYASPLTGAKSYEITTPGSIKWIVDPTQSGSSRALLQQAKAKALREGNPALAKRIQRLLDGLGRR